MIGLCPSALYSQEKDSRLRQQPGAWTGPNQDLARRDDFFMRFGFTRARNVVDYDSNIKRKPFSTRTFGWASAVF